MKKTLSRSFHSVTAITAVAIAVLSHAPSTFAMDLKARSAEIDKLVTANLAKQKLSPTEAITDEVFVRSIFLDIAGRIPSLKETTEFLADASPDKRAKLIDSLMESEG